MAKVIFLQQVWFPLESVMALSAALKAAGHKTAVAVGGQEKVIKELRAFGPDIIAFPIITPYRKFMIEVCTAVRASGIKSLILVGGYDASFFPDIIYNAPIDVLCVGEGDDAIVELANAVDKGEDYSNIKNLWVKKNGKLIKNPIRPFKDVDEKMFEDRDIYRDYDPYFNDIEFEQVMVGRGCPYSCSYCFNHQYRQLYAPVSRKYCDLRDVDKVIEECLILKNKYKVKNIFFNDSTLGYNKKWLLEFLKKYGEKVGLPFTINATVKEIDEDFCKAIADTGKCFIIRIGLETGNERFRAKVLNKPITNEEYIKATDLMKKYKIKYSMAIMLGLPGETLEYAFETLDFASKLSAKNSVVATNIFKPFPKLDITEYGVKIGQYKRELIEDSNLIGDNVMNIFQCFRDDEVGKKIINLARLSQIYLHFPLLRALIKNRLIHRPDNTFYRKIQQYSDYYYTNRHHVNASWGYLVKYWLAHRNKIGSIN